jgi:hypothetical protein
MVKEMLNDAVGNIWQAILAGGGDGGGNFNYVVGTDPTKVTVLMAGLSGEETKAGGLLITTHSTDILYPPHPPPLHVYV